MALEGSIKDFGVADILQLISQQQKTGILLVEHHDASAEIYFAAGTVVEARSSDQAARLEEMIVKNGLLSRVDMQRFVEKARQTLEPLGIVLLRESGVERDVLERILTTQLYETFYKILQWREGTYRFIPHTVKTDANLVQVPGLESILLDVLRMIDEWPSVKTSLRSLTAVFERDAEAADEKLDEEEQLVLSCFDGKKTLQEIIDTCILGRFATGKIIVDLIEKGCLRFIGEQAESLGAQVASARRIMAITSYVVVLAMFLIILLLPTGFPHSVLPFFEQSYIRGSLLDRYSSHLALRHIVTCLDTYFLQNGRCPDTIDELKHAGIIGVHDIAALTEKAGCSYTCQGTTYSITCGR